MFYLQEWIHQIAGTVLGAEHVTRAGLEKYQLLRLLQTLRYAYERSSFYRELFDSEGIGPDDVQSLSDLSRLPLTEPTHISESPYRFLCVSQSEVERPYSFVTSGTTGPQKKIFWSLGDLERIVEFMAAGIATAAGTDDVVLVMLADGRPYSQSDLLCRGVRRLGATPIAAGADLSPEETLELIEKNRGTILFGYTNRLFRISRELQHRRELSRAGIKVLFAAGEYVPDAMRRDLERIWNCSVRTHYGLTEMGLGVAVECDAQNGYHFNEAGLLLEVIDPSTGCPVPPGNEGELVFTTLTREAMPLIRYRTHDISMLIPGPCPCGAESLLRLGSVKKRLESIVTMEGGDQIYPSMFDDVLFEVPGIVDYQIALKKHDGRDRLEFTVDAVSAGPDAVAQIRSKILTLPVIRKMAAAGKMEEPMVVLAQSGALRTASRAKKLICV